MDLIQDSESTAVEGVTNFVQRLEQTFKRASHMVQRAQERQKIQADKRRREQIFRVGEQVLFSTEHLQLKNAPIRKLRKRFVGPFFVTKRIGPVAFELELPQTWKIHPVLHTSLLRPFRTSTWSTRTEPAVDDLELEEDDRSYEVKRLLRWR